MIDLQAPSARFFPPLARCVEQEITGAAALVDYASPSGSIRCRSLIADAISCDVEEVLLVDGAGEAMFVLLSAFRRTENTLFLPALGFPGYRAFANALGYATILYDPTTFLLSSDVAATTGSCNLRTRGRGTLIVSLPHNPSGFMPDEKQIFELISSAELCDPLVILDCAAHFCELPDAAHRMSEKLTASGFRCLLLCSLGKALGCPGLRLCYVHTSDPRVSVEFRALNLHVCRSPCALATQIATSLLSNHDFRLLFGSARRILAERRGWMLSFSNSLGAMPLTCHSGCFVYTTYAAPLSALGLEGMPGDLFGGSSGAARYSIGVDESTWVSLTEQFTESSK